MDISAWILTRTRMIVIDGKPLIRELAPRMECADGFHLSVQAGRCLYCEPRTDEGPWTAFEIGFPSAPEEMLMEYAEDKENPTGTVYGRVPGRVVNEVLDAHGGFACVHSVGSDPVPRTAHRASRWGPDRTERGETMAEKTKHTPGAMRAGQIIVGGEQRSQETAAPELLEALREQVDTCPACRIRKQTERRGKVYAQCSTCAKSRAAIQKAEGRAR